MGAAFTTISHTSAAGGQGGLSNLQRFKVHHPLTFMGGRDPMVGRPLVPVDRKGVGGYGDHLRHYTDSISSIPTRG